MRTVIPAACAVAIAFFASGLSVSATATKMDAGHIPMTYIGGTDADMCIGINWTATANNGTYIDSMLMGDKTGSDILQVGTTGSLESNEPRTHVVGVAYFADDTQQVIFDSKI